MKKIALILIVISIVNFGCKKGVKISSLRTDANQVVSDESQLETQIKNFYRAVADDNKEEITKYLDDKILTINAIEAVYKIDIQNAKQVADLLQMPGFDNQPLNFEKFPNYDFENGKWEKSGIFIEKVNENPFKEILKMSANSFDRKQVNNIASEIKYKVLHTNFGTITYWTKKDNHWKIVAIEFLDI